MTEPKDNPSKPISVLVPAGSLGAGVREDEVAYGIARGAMVIASDAGSTDSGAAYLALGISKNNRQSVKRDLTIMMKQAWAARIPIVIGTSGQAGGDKNLDWTRDIAVEIARELGITPKIALLRSELDKATVKAKNAAGRIRPLAPLGALDDATIDACDHIVAALGPEPYIAALDAGADIILGGRTTDTAVIASYALWKGAPAGPSWHAGKIAECGAQCTEKVEEGAGVLLRIDRDSFEVEPLSTANRCTPHSVSAHMLYENSDPFRLVEPGGVLDVTASHYAQIDPRTVKVTGSVWEPKPYTMKLEGASSGRFQTVMLVGIQDPVVLNNLDAFHDRMLGVLYDRVHKAVGEAAGDFHLSLRLYGWNAVSGDKVPAGTPAPREVGVLFVATADTQEMATQIAKACNPYFFHMYMPEHEEMPSYGFAFTPADIERGPVYEFRLNHVVECDDPMELVRTEWVDLALEEAA
ncbi:acyclic terpene utilization AtuA family protein [Novosphingobium sp. UBA1939]|uniref:acyclic terpene utilization AtuA family protein n=1 Tax=Novosphingobium sp. UBA1939 TaxID=1946982 RepID=UPI0025F80749|nr:acyclic terpene utilization AtuA family protein [Novosphingobium sp. UBA1939]